MKPNLFLLSIVLLCITLISPLYGNTKSYHGYYSSSDFMESLIGSMDSNYNRSSQFIFDSQISSDDINSSSLIDIDSLQVVGGFQEFYFVENEVSKEAEFNESSFSMDNEMVLEKWMMEAFAVERMDQELVLEEWMLEPFDKN